MNKTITLLLFMIFLSARSQGSEFKRLIPISNKIICLYFEDGYINHPKLGQIPWKDGEVFLFPIDSIKVKSIFTYSVESALDSDFINLVNPIKIGRKTKGIDFLDKDTPGKKYNYRIPGHWIYLEFEKPLKQGQQYTIRFAGLDSNHDSLQFIYNDFEHVSESIHVNQVGYSTEARLKYGYVYHWMGDMGEMKLDMAKPRAFYLVDSAENQIMYKGELKLSRDLTNAQPVVPFYKNDFCMAPVYLCDFSGFNLPGQYKLVVEGIGSSFPFEISKNGYKDAYKTVLSGLFHHRSGIDRNFNYSKWIKPVEHKPGVNGFSIQYSRVRHMDGGNNFSGLPANATGEIFPTSKGKWMPKNNDDWGWGGYFDAGDYDRQSGHIVAAEYLLFAYEFRPENFLDNELNIPESGNGIPDIIDEAKWVIDCFRRLQGPTGGICGGMEENEHPLPGENSVTDSRPWYVYAEEPRASFRLSSAATQLAYCLEMAGTVNESDSLIRQAKRVYQWAKSNRDASRVRNYWMRAASWLYKYTGEKQYLDDFLQLYKSGIKDDFALFVYATTLGKEKDAGILQAILSSYTSQADNLIKEGMKHPASLIPGASSGWSTINFLINVDKLIFAYQLTNNQKYLDFVYTTCDYNLGANPENLVFVTGLGEKPINDVFNMDSWYDNIEESIPGIVPYGLAKEFVSDDKTAVWRPYQTYTSCYPDYKTWPSGELWFENRYLINCNEYTITETIAPAAGAYAFVSGEQWSNFTDRGIRGLNLNIETLTILKGDTKRLGVAVLPYYADNKNIEWISLDTTVCKVDSHGFVLGYGKGNTKIVVKTLEGNYTDTCNVHVFSNMTSVYNLKTDELQYNAYPSPAKDCIKVEFKNLNYSQNYLLKMFSSTGELVIKREIDVDSNSMTIDLSFSNKDIKSGLYFLVLSDGQMKSSTKKIIVL